MHIFISLLLILLCGESEPLAIPFPLAHTSFTLQVEEDVGGDADSDAASSDSEGEEEGGSEEQPQKKQKAASAAEESEEVTVYFNLAPSC